jgi:hypothetical protein
MKDYYCHGGKSRSGCFYCPKGYLKRVANKTYLKLIEIAYKNIK